MTHISTPEPSRAGSAKQTTKRPVQQHQGQQGRPFPHPRCPSETDIIWSTCFIQRVELRGKPLALSGSIGASGGFASGAASGGVLGGLAEAVEDEFGNAPNGFWEQGAQSGGLRLAEGVLGGGILGTVVVIVPADALKRMKSNLQQYTSAESMVKAGNLKWLDPRCPQRPLARAEVHR